VTDILTNDEVSLLRSLEKKSRTITGNFTHNRYDRLETKGYIKRSPQSPSMQDMLYEITYAGKAGAEGCGWRLRFDVQCALRVAAATRQRKPWVAFARQKFTRIGVLCRFSRCWLDQTSNHLQKGLLLRTVCCSCKEVAQLNLRHSPPQLGCSPDATRIFRLRGFDTDTSDHHLNYCRVLSYEHFPWPVLHRKTTFGSGSGSPFTHMTRTHIGRSENPAVQRSPAVPRRGVLSFEAAAQERGQQRLTSIQNNSDLHQGDQHSYYGLAFARPLQ
jgi:hypothetical protein